MLAVFSFFIPDRLDLNYPFSFPASFTYSLNLYANGNGSDSNLSFLIRSVSASRTISSGLYLSLYDFKLCPDRFLLAFNRIIILYIILYTF